MNHNGNTPRTPRNDDEFCREVSEEFRRFADRNGSVVLQELETGEKIEISASQFVLMFGLDELTSTFPDFEDGVGAR
jgi:hypothetical protein